MPHSEGTAVLDAPRPRVATSLPSPSPAAAAAAHALPRLSVRAYAFLLVLAVAVPLTALLMAALRQIAAQEEETAKIAVRQVARTAAAEADLYLGDARATLEQVASRAGVRQADGHCDAVFGEFAQPQAGLVNLLLVDLAGRPLCRTLGLPQAEASYAERPWFKAVVQKGQRFSADAPHASRGNRQWVVAVAVPVRRPDNAVVGVLVAGLDLSRIRTVTLGGSDLPSASTVDLIDGSGLLLARSTGVEDVGSRLSGELIERVLAEHSGAVRGIGPDGVDKLAGFAPLNAVPWTAVVSTPTDAALAASRRSTFNDSVAVAVILALTLLSAAFVARRLLRPIHSIADVAGAVARGDLKARASAGGPRELADIAAQMNRMLEQRQRDESALRDSELRFRQLFETSTDAILIVDRDARIVFANAAVQRVLGYRPTALAGREVSMLLPAAVRRALARFIERFFGAGERTPDRPGMEFRGLHADGHEVPLEVTLSHLRIGGADVFAAFLRDISSRKRAEAELRDSEARFRHLADSAPSLIWMASADGGCFYVNKRWIEYTGRTLEQACGAGWMQSVHPEDRSRVVEHNDAAFDESETFSIEYRLRRHDGEYRWMLNHGTPRLAADGTLLGYIGTCIDIHDRVSAERRIRRLSTLYAALSKANEAMARTRATSELLSQVCSIAVEHGGFHVATVGLIDEDGAAVRTVAAAGHTLGIFENRVLSLAPDAPRRNAPSLIAMREDRPFISNDRDADPRAAPLENRAARAVMRSTAALPLHREGRVTGFLTVHAGEVDYFDDEMVELLVLLAADLSFALGTMAANERREDAEGALRQLNATLEQKVEERTRSLQAANRELEAFSYSVSHDLRAPLRAISGFTEMLAEGHLERLDHEARGYLERVRAAAQRMSRLIDDLMNLSRVARMDLRRETLDLSRMAAEVVAELQENDPQRAVQVRITPGLTAHADRGLTQIVLANLLGNAWKFTTRSARPSIAFGAVEHDGRPAFFVRDNGAGFDMQHADKLFAPFARLHAEQEFAGTGIGLALVQRIVQRHDGFVAAQSAEGEGTTITFALG